MVFHVRISFTIDMRESCYLREKRKYVKVVICNQALLFFVCTFDEFLERRGENDSGRGKIFRILGGGGEICLGGGGGGEF